MGTKKKKMMSIELKREIIEKHEEGVRVIDLARKYGRSTSMICTVLKQKEVIKAMTPAKGITIISRLRTSLHEQMEKQLMEWVTEKQLQGGILTQSIICEKARAIYGDLLKQNPHTSANEESEDSFKASRGWFDNFRKRTGIQSVKHGEAARSDVEAAEVCIKTFSELIEAKGYIPQQVFNFWRKMPKRTYITAEEKTMPGHKFMKDRLTVTLCTNASGDYKIKPFKGLEPKVSVVEETLGNSIRREVGESDENELAAEQSQELTTGELHDLQSQKHTVAQREISIKKEPGMEEEISTKDIREILGMWEKIAEFVHKNHPEKVATGRASELFNDTCLTHFQNILKGRKEQTSLDSFLKRSSGENEESMTKKAKTGDEN